jgi:hypothetical protein
MYIQYIPDSLITLSYRFYILVDTVWHRRKYIIQSIDIKKNFILLYILSRETTALPGRLPELDLCGGMRKLTVRERATSFTEEGFCMDGRETPCCIWDSEPCGADSEA